MNLGAISLPFLLYVLSPCVLISGYPLHYDVLVSESAEVMSQNKPLILQNANVEYFVPGRGKLTNTL